MKDIVWITGGAIASLIFIGALISVPVEYLLFRECRIFEQNTGMKTKRQIFDSCYVMHQGRYMRYSEYKAIITAREGLSK